MGRFKHILLFISIVVCLSDSVPLPHNVQSLAENDDSQKDVSEQIESVNEKVNNNLFEGDIILDNNTRDVDGTQDGNVKRNAQRDRARLWKTKVVPYIIAPDLSSQTRIIQEAFDEFLKHTCVTFVPRTSESNWIYFVKKSGCYSYVGKSYWRTGGQDVSIGSGCAYKGTIIHELLHALGFWHEQSRPDRDKYVRILWENIKPGKDHNFKKYDHGRIDSLKATYDLGSIMHYGKYSFSSNGKPTIEAINDPNRQLGQRSGFSQTDIFEVNALYDCSGPAHGWSSWSDYGPCDRTCDKIRQRFCASSDRSNCPGADSYGVETETTICYANECSVSHHCEFEVDMCIWKTDPNNNYRWHRRQGQTSSQNTGPDGDATQPLNGAGFYIYAEASNPVIPHQKTQLTSPVFNATSGRCLEFAYSMYGSAMGSLDVYVENVKSGTKKTIFTTSGNQGQGWHRTNATITSSSDYKVVFEVTRGSSYTSDVALDDIFFKDGKCGGQGPTIFGADCNFDQDMCGWMPGPKTNLRWIRRSGRTPSRKTGPRRDHTSGSGYYVYVETSSPARPNQIATLVSRVFPPAPAGRCMSFYYHMYGSDMGSLNVYIRSAFTAVQVRVFRISGNQRKKWRRGMVNISNMICDYQIVFEGVRGSGRRSDMALDDITFTSSPCPKRKRG